MLGRVEQRRDGASRLAKVGGWGWCGPEEPKTARPVVKPCSPEGLQRHPPGVLPGTRTLWLGPVLVATCSKMRDMRSNSIRRK